MSAVPAASRPCANDSRFDVLGVPVSSINMDDAIETIVGWVRDGRRSYVCITGAHGIVECRRDGVLRDIHAKAGMVTPDGMPLVWVARLRGLGHVRRVYGPDLLRALSSEERGKGLRHFYYGGAPGVAGKLEARLRQSHRDLDVAGTITPPFRLMSAQEDEAVVDAINAACPDILWVGLSTPKQERWMSEHRDLLHVPVMIGVGAAFDFVSGVKSQAPSWVGDVGLEWLFRLASEPGRLAGRYAAILPPVLALVTAEASKAVRRRMIRAIESFINIR